MHSPLLSLPLVLLLSSCTWADFLGPSYPVPADLSSNQSLVAESWKNVTSILQAYISDGDQRVTSEETEQIKNLTFSLGMFSLNDPAATELQFHYTSPEIVNSLNGTHHVDQDSIYRIASLTKVFTVLAGLLNLNDTY